MNFLQSKEWAEFQESVGHKPFWIENKLLLKFHLPLGYCYLYSPRPHFKDQNEFESFIKEAKKIAKNENAIFLRLEPDLIENSLTIGNCPPCRKAGKLKISKCIQPQDTLIMNLGHNEETLLKNMHPKTRYNIRLAEKHNIKIAKTTDPEQIDFFYNLSLKTSIRDNFKYHARAYYKEMLKLLGEKNIVKLFIAFTKENIPTAAILVMHFHKTAIYLHGASDWEYRNLMSPYLLQWETIKDAKKNGCEFYDFWGVAPEGKTNHAWSGITRFKQGFAPNEKVIHYPNCFDIPLNGSLYSFYKLIKLFRG